MASPADSSTIDDNELDAMFAALASAPRRAIIGHLAAGRTTTPRLGANFDFSKQALNRHLVALEEAGMIRRRLVGRVHDVELAPDRLEAVTGWAEQIRAAWGSNLRRLGDVLDEFATDGDEATGARRSP